MTKNQLNTENSLLKRINTSFFVVILALILFIVFYQSKLKPVTIYKDLPAVTNTVVKTIIVTNSYYITPDTNHWYDCFKYRPLPHMK